MDNVTPPIEQGPVGPGGSRDEILQRVNGPGISLMVTAIIGMLLQLLGMLSNLLGVGLGAAEGGEDQLAVMMSGGVGVVANIIGIIIGVIVLIGAMKMRKLESYGLAMTASILAMIPCVSPCCILGLPFGIWAVVVLAKPEVKEAFT